MNKTELTIGMIGYRPTMLESMKISFIGEVFGLTYCAIMRELIYGHWTLDELYSIARKTSPGHNGFTLPYLRKTFDPKKGIDTNVKNGERLFVQDMLGINEQDEWKFLDHKK